MKIVRWLTWLTLLGILAACGLTPTSQQPTAGTSLPTQVQRPATESVYTALQKGRTAEGYHFLGDANAPVTLQFYSDFL
jgi:hypothetical protein